MTRSFKQTHGGEAVVLAIVDSIGTMHILNCSASHPLFQKEALRIAHGMNEWEPATKDGKPVTCDVVFFIPLNPERHRKQIKAE